MKFPKYSNYMLILFLIVLSFILRFPDTSHSVGIDAFVMQGLANCIAEDGYAAWIIHPLSYFGLFPLSYPSGGIFLPASLMVLSGYSSEISILVLSFLMGLVGVLGSWLLAREFRDDDLFVFIVALLFCLAPKFILNTTWETPTRGGFMAFTPIFLWTVLRAHKEPNRKNTLMPLLILFALATFHRLAILMLIVILAYICTYIFLILVKIAKLKVPKLFLRTRARERIRFLGVMAFLLVGAVLIIGSGVMEMYQWGVIAEENSFQVKAMNLAISLTRSSGAIAPLLLVGAVALAYQRNKTLKDSFVLFIVLAIIPTLYLRRYTGFYIPTFLSLLAGMGVIGILLLGRRNGKMFIALLVGIVVGSIAVSGVLLDYENQSTKSMSMQEYGTGLYASQYLDGTLLWNNGLVGSRVTAVSGLPYLPIGGATVPRNGPEQLAYGFVLSSDLHVAQVPIDKLTLNSDSPFIAYDSPNAQAEWTTIHSGVKDDPSFPETNRLIEEYDIQYALEDKGIFNQYAAFSRTYFSKFLDSTHGSNYKIFESEHVIAWSL
jgi:hypothetical protein